MNQEYVKKIQEWVVLDNKALEIKNRIKDIQEDSKDLLNQKDEIEKGLKLGAKKYLIKATLTLDEILYQVNDLLS